MTCLPTQQECRSTSRSSGAPIKMWLTTQQECRSTNRSAEAPTGVPKHQQECRSTNQECRSTNRTSTHSFFGPRYSYDHISFRTYNPSLSHSMFMTFFISYSGFMPIPYGISILIRYDAYPHIIQIFLSFYESILLRNWNQSNRIIQTEVNAFSYQLVILPILPEGQFEILPFSEGLTSYLALSL